ncbi:metabotropic glutamate receptor 1-like [Venturia canescens]|uniref:metabotropic glutamate receptor 1-like n=1 Tax=Venturia canescens TaxID=32260 RepID=UPI001C9C60DF|nr:metabotropic glutamate receptor 1-like [Venturia canescens]XP_043266636.1 metabotropic glutamate receptor 1-like [Venturia canescens]XP_043266637.1 metabotropic glutamate receptor 1-like [Venturia canescens]
MSYVREILRVFSFLTVIIGSVNMGDPSARVRGDLVIGALFSVHRAPSGGHGALVCGTVRELYGIERVETALITLDKINRDNTILPGVTLGLEARDSCWSAPVSLQQSIELVRDAITPALTQPQLASSGASATCQVDSVLQTESPVSKAPIVGVIGPGSSSAALQVQNLLQLFSIPQIGYSPTSRDLSDKTRYPTFLRVVPSDYYQAQLLVDLVQYFNWTYVSIVNTDENYGQSGMQAFRELAERNGVCVAREDAVLSTAEESVFDGVLTNLDQDRFANVVVCFCEGMTMRGLLGATKRLNLTGRFVFIGSDGWADRDDVVENLENEARGSLSIRIYSPYINEFDDHYFSLNPFNNTRNPWFVEFWQHKFNCVMPKTASLDDETDEDVERVNDSRTDKKISHRVLSSTESPDTRKICTGTEKLSEKYKQDPKMSFVMKSFWAMAHGLHSMLEEICGRGYYGVCKEMYPFNGTLFKNHLMNISFTFGEEEVEFDRRGDPPGRYEILNFQELKNGSYGYVQIGDWNNGTLTFSASPLSWRRTTELVTSVCSKPCQPGHYKNFKTGGQEKKCCWACVPCDYHEIVNEEQTACVACPAGQKPNGNKTKCDVILVEHISWGDAEAVVAMSFSAMGLMATFVTCHIFIRHNDTPVVKASTRELSYLILAGMTLAHITVFPILAEPSRITCGLSRLMPGISFAMMYASLFTKTNRIARILAGSKKRFPKRKPLFMSATAQVVITCFLIMLEAGIAAAMLVIEPPMPRYEYPTRDRSVLTCATSPRAVLSPLAFDGLLVALCTLYAVKTRNVPENFNEAKFIGFAMYTTCVIWIAFGPIYFGSESKVVTMCMCVTLSASVTLVFLFLPKLYIIVLRPERNNRALFTTSKSMRCHIGARVAAAIAEPPAKQAIYRLATGDSEITDQRSSVSRRTLSVQTGAELLTGLCKQDDRSTSPMLRFFEDPEYPDSPSWRCKFDKRICKSSDNVQLRPRNCENETILKEFGDSSFVQRSHEKLYASAKSLGSRLSLFVGRSETSIKSSVNSKTRLSDWLELDPKVLIVDSQVRDYLTDEKNHAASSQLRSNPRNGNASGMETTNSENGASAGVNNEIPAFLRERKTRILEERGDQVASNGQPVINITITLGSDLPDLRDLGQSAV